MAKVSKWSLQNILKFTTDRSIKGESWPKSPLKIKISDTIFQKIVAPSILRVMKPYMAQNDGLGPYFSKKIKSGKKKFCHILMCYCVKNEILR